MNPYREILIGPPRTNARVTLPNTTVPSGVLIAGFATVLVGVSRMTRSFEPIGIGLALVGCALLAMSLLPTGGVQVALHREARVLELGDGPNPRRMITASLDQIVIDRTPLFVQVRLRTKSGEEVVVWRGLAPFAGDQPSLVQTELLALLESNVSEQ